MATPDNKAGARPAKISGQNLSADCITEICAAIAPSATAASFSETAPLVSVRRAALRCDLVAISGKRIIATIGASIRSPAIDADPAPDRPRPERFFIEMSPAR